MTVKCEDCGFVDETTSISAGIIINEDGRGTCRRCGSENIVSFESKDD